jgi:signal transduction histidine kinase
MASGSNESPASETKLRPATRARSLRQRVTLSILLLSALMQVGLGIVIAAYQNASTERLFNTRIGLRLSDMATRLESLEYLPSTADLRRLETESLRFILFDYVSIAVFASSGELIASTHPPSDVIDASLLAGVEQRTRFVAPKAEVNLVSGEPPMPARFGLQRITLANGQSAVLVLGAGDQNAREFTASTTRLLSVAIIGSLATSAIATWLIVGRALAPLLQIGSLAKLVRPEHVVTEGSTQPELPGERYLEIAELRSELEVARLRLREAFAAQDRFISNVSHELKTPIAVLLTEAETLNQSELGPAGEEFVRSSIEEMKRLAAMIESFLVLTRIRVGKAHALDKRFSIVEATVEAVAHCEKLARQHGVSVLPIAAEGADLDVEVVGDPMLAQVMVEGLVRNAIRFSASGDRVEVRVERRGESATVQVRDNGPGIPEEIRSRLFERFVQASSEAQRGRGTGLGLSIAQGIAELHGGIISFENRSPVGCTFTIRLPVADARPAVTAHP